MPRIRSLKPEFWSSPGNNGTDPWARLLFMAMWNWADDYGRGTLNVRELAGFAFPHDDDPLAPTASELPSLLTEVQCKFGVVFYEVSGRRYYAIPSWESHNRNERRATSRNPAPEEGVPFELSPSELPKQEDARKVLAASVETHGSSVRSDGASATGTGEPGNRGKKTPSPRGEAAPDRFDEFWSVYPRKADKADARRAWAKAIKSTDPDRLIAAAKRYAISVHGSEAQFIKHGATWLNKGSFDNAPELRVVGAPTDPDEAFARLRLTADAKAAARLIGQQWLDPAKPPSDPTPMGAFLKAARIAFIDEHADAIQSALRAAEGRAV
jgi:hypothetical protein